jgi:pre-60S factor REI1
VQCPNLAFQTQGATETQPRPAAPAAAAASHARREVLQPAVAPVPRPAHFQQNKSNHDENKIDKNNNTIVWGSTHLSEPGPCGHHHHSMSAALAAAKAARSVRAGRQDLHAVEAVALPPPQQLQCGSCHLRFGQRADLKAHYKSELHRCNLQRRVQDLEPLTLAQFDARQAQLLSEGLGKAELRERRQEERLERQIELSRHSQQPQPPAAGEQGAGVLPPTACGSPPPAPGEGGGAEEAEAAALVPTRCPISRVELGSVEAVSQHLMRTYGFFIPDAEHLVDLDGLMAQLREQLVRGHSCWCCGRGLRSYGATVQHMIDKCHCKLPDSVMGTHPLIAPFYQFDALQPSPPPPPPPVARAASGSSSDWVRVEGDAGEEVVHGLPQMASGDSGDFELIPPPSSFDAVLAGDGDVSDGSCDSDDGDDGDDCGTIDGVPSGRGSLSLVLPSGRVLGHRSQARFYRQNHVRAAAAGCGGADDDGDLGRGAAGALADDAEQEVGVGEEEESETAAAAAGQQQVAGWAEPGARAATRRAQRDEGRRRVRQEMKCGVVAQSAQPRHWTQGL